jgi:hypothetical protein
MADWDFVLPEEETQEEKPTTSGHLVQFRPNRMALGCSAEMIQEKISENAKKARLSKLLKTRGIEDDGEVAYSSRVAKSDSDTEFSKAKVSKVISKPPTATTSVPVNQPMTKSQKKRHKRKIQLEQKKLVNTIS